MFRIKVCGITNVADARMVAESGADAVGLNFFPKSVRYLPTLDLSRHIIDAIPPSITKVGLFVNTSYEEVFRTFDTLGLDLIQLHGDETPGDIRKLEGRPVLRAFRVGANGLRPVADYLQECVDLGCPLQMVLIDSLVKGEYGGTGEVGNWPALCGSIGQYDTPPIVLAGGLTADNVAEAIRTVRPAAVDTASGVESSPGHKDEQAVNAFVRAAKAAFGDI